MCSRMFILVLFIKKKNWKTVQKDGENVQIDTKKNVKIKKSGNCVAKLKALEIMSSQEPLN